MNNFLKLLAALMIVALCSCQEEESLDPEKAFYVKLTNASDVKFTDINGKYGKYTLKESSLEPGESTDSLLIDSDFVADLITVKIDGESWSVVPDNYFISWLSPVPGLTYNFDLRLGANKYQLEILSED